MMKLFNFRSFSAALICLLIASCAASVQEVDRSREKPIEINKITVVPFFYESDYLEKGPSPAASEKGTTPQVPSDKGRAIAEDLYNEMASKIKRVNTAYFGTAAEEFEKIRKKNPGISYEDAALRVGEYLEADAVLVGNLFEYRERKGGELGVTTPASVAFGVRLLNAGTGEIIWEAYFTETQRPLLQNVFELDKFIKRGGKWITADRLAEEGVVEIVNRLDNFLNKYLAAN